jgi:hypothetical protein
MGCVFDSTKKISGKSQFRNNLKGSNCHIVLQNERGATFMALQPYVPNWQAVERFNPKSFVDIPNAYSAAIIYLKRFYGETAVKIFENVVRDNFRGEIKEEDLPKIAKIMYNRAIFVEETVRKKWVSHLSQIAYARIGEGDPMKGYIMSFIS